MQNWQIITDEERSAVWDFIYDVLEFLPYNKSYRIKCSMPYKYFDISGHYGENFSMDEYDDLCDTTIAHFQELAQGERLYAMDWHHTCYIFSPELPFELDEFSEWLVPIFPNGDHIFFLTRDLKNGVFGDGINMALCYFGSEMLHCLEKRMPKILC